MLMMLALLALIVAFAILCLLLFAASRPDDFSVSRTARIQTPPEKIFPLINDLKAMNGWNPFVASVPEGASTYSGPASGNGATYAWDAKGRAGAGRFTVTGSTPPSRVVMQLDMLKPFEGHNQVTFTLAPAGGSTDVTWAMTGKHAFIPKVMGVVMSMDKMVGGSFEKGLADLKTMAERS